MRTSVPNLVRVAAKAGGSDLYVSGLHWITGKHQLQKHFTQFGEVASAQVPINWKTGFNNGYGFVTFTNKSVVSELLSSKKRHYVDGVQVAMRRCS